LIAQPQCARPGRDSRTWRGRRVRRWAWGVGRRGRGHGAGAECAGLISWPPRGGDASCSTTLAGSSAERVRGRRRHSLDLQIGLDGRARTRSARRRTPHCGSTARRPSRLPTTRSVAADSSRARGCTRAGGSSLCGRRGRARTHRGAPRGAAYWVLLTMPAATLLRSGAPGDVRARVLGRPRPAGQRAIAATLDSRSPWAPTPQSSGAVWAGVATASARAQRCAPVHAAVPTRGRQRGRPRAARRRARTAGSPRNLLLAPPTSSPTAGAGCARGARALLRRHALLAGASPPARGPLHTRCCLIAAGRQRIDAIAARATPTGARRRSCTTRSPGR
jgi:hypothetical protein